MGTASKTRRTQETVSISGHQFTMRTKDPERLKRSAEWVNQRVDSLTKEYPLMKLNEIYLLMALEMAFEQLDFVENGKDLLKQTDDLIKWMDRQLS